jgi:hypothetical protein
MGTITLTGPDGNDVDFQIEGTFPTQDELARFNVVLGNKPQEDTGPAPEVMDTAPSLGTPSIDDPSSFLLPDAVPDDTTPSQTAPAIQPAGGTVIGDPPVITEPEKRDSDEILPAGPEIDYSASINRTGSNDTEVDDDTSAAAVSEEQPAPEFT